MSSVKLKHSSGNGTIINGPAANPSADITLKVPSTTGEAGQVLSVATANHSATNAELEWAAAGGGSVSNLIINGAMTVAQRGTSHTGLGGTAGKYHLDRWRTSHTMTTGRYTATQDSSAPAGFAKSLKIDITTAEASLNAASAACILQILEGQDIQHLQKGTATAKSLTVSFWVKSTTTGTYILEVQDSDNSRILNKSYTISSANTWEKKTLTFAGDTTGAFTDDNGASLLFNFYLAAGTDFTSGTLGSSWAATTNANRAVGQTNLFAADTNDFYLTGVQAEVGDSANDFEHLPYGRDLERCKRYFQKLDFYKYSGTPSNYYYYNDTIILSPSMRATPTLDDTTDWKLDTGDGQFQTSGGTQTDGAHIDGGSDHSVTFRHAAGAAWSYAWCRLWLNSEL